MNDFLPINNKEMLERGWQDVDFVFVTGDSYVDHPSFGVAILTRLLENESYKAAGVDVTAGYKSVELMKQHVARTKIDGVVSGIGGTDCNIVKEE